MRPGSDFPENRIGEFGWPAGAISGGDGTGLLEAAEMGPRLERDRGSRFSDAVKSLAAPTGVHRTQFGGLDLIETDKAEIGGGVTHQTRAAQAWRSSTASSRWRSGSLTSSHRPQASRRCRRCTRHLRLALARLRTEAPNLASLVSDGHLDLDHAIDVIDRDSSVT
jgi:hypothetical protein